MFGSFKKCINFASRKLFLLHILLTNLKTEKKMKKFFMMAAMAVMALTASAQLTINPQFGAGYGTISDSGDIDGGIICTFGADLGYQVNEKFSASAGLEYGYWESDEVDKQKIKIGTFNVPVLAHYNILENLSVFGGVKFNFIASAKYSIDGNDSSIKNECNSMLLTIPLGVRYNLTENWNVSASYQIPTTKINKNGSADQKITPIMVTVGYKLGI